jgi:hypothetical protein
MKKFILPILLLLLASSGTRAQIEPGRDQPKTNNVLFDFRVDPKVNQLKIPPATSRAVLTKVFGRYLTDDSRCNADFAADAGDDYLTAARKSGQIVPTIVDTTTGSFTAQGQQQTLYVISVGECNASHADNYGSKRVAIFSGQKLVANMDVEFKSSILRKTDFNGDGMDELLMEGGDMHQAIVVEVAALLDFRDGRLHVIEDFGMVSEDACASGIPGSGVRASVISVLPAGPGSMPKLKRSNYSSSCRNVKRWKFLSTGKME